MHWHNVTTTSKFVCNCSACLTRHPISNLHANIQVPTLETPEGGVFESNAIARYVARLADKGLFGTTLLDTVRSACDARCELRRASSQSVAPQNLQTSGGEH